MDDAVFEGPHTSTITHAAASSDANYNGITINNVVAKITDNDAGTETILYLALNNGVTLPGGLMVANEDIVNFNGTDFSLFFDGSDVGLGSTSVDAFAVIAADEILLSFAAPETIPGIVGTVQDSDIVKFTATGLGDTTSGTFELFFRGSDVGLSPTSEDIDALDLHPDGRLIVSTIGNFDVTGVSGGDEDLIAFTPLTSGDYLSGTWAMYFDGSDVQLSGEDVNAAALDANGNIHVSTTNAFSVTGVSGDDEDVFTFTPSQLGDSTAGTYVSALLFDGSLFGLSANDVNGIDIPIPAALHGRAISVGEPSNSGDAAARLTQREAESILAASITLWVSALGVQLPTDARIEVADLPGNLLGTAGQGVITLDVDAGGVGWFVDPTPLENSEFPIAFAPNSFLATPGSPAVERFDLLTVVLHELGHLIGLDHSSSHEDPQNVMNASLDVRVRRVPASNSREARPEENQVLLAASQTAADDLFAGRDLWLSAVSLVENTNPAAGVAAKAGVAIDRPMAVASSGIPLRINDERGEAAAIDEFFTDLGESFKVLESKVARPK